MLCILLSKAFDQNYPDTFRITKRWLFILCFRYMKTKDWYPNNNNVFYTFLEYGIYCSSHMSMHIF